MLNTTCVIICLSYRKLALRHIVGVDTITRLAWNKNYNLSNSIALTILYTNLLAGHASKPYRSQRRTNQSTAIIQSCCSVYSLQRAAKKEKLSQLANVVNQRIVTTRYTSPNAVRFKYSSTVRLGIKFATRMRADAQHSGRPAEYRWRPLFNAAKFA